MSPTASGQDFYCGLVYCPLSYLRRRSQLRIAMLLATFCRANGMIAIPTEFA
ncbi:MAG: hypothetical protein ABSD99_09790 [Candidatus Bathyarchaeia archaeon]